MPTSASTGTEQTSTAGKTSKATKEAPASDVNTPDGAPVVTKPEDVVGGVRVNIPPDAPNPDAFDIAAHQGGTMQVMRPDGTMVSLDTDAEDFEERRDAVASGEANH
jgi:hypothetical protein